MLVLEFGQKEVTNALLTDDRVHKEENGWEYSMQENGRSDPNILLLMGAVLSR